MRTIGQERAEFALQVVLENKAVDKLKPFSAGAPTVILQNGFGQAMAFWRSRGDGKDKNKKYTCIFDSVKKWLKNNDLIESEGDRDEEFILKLSQVSQKEYINAQKEAVLLLEWIKRYASAFCEDKKKGGTSDD